MINLLNNANKYTSNGKISLDIKLTKETDDNVLIRFCITDTGIGIDPEFFEIIFDKFQHGSDSIKEKYGGSGVGLYIVKHFLSLHNSEIIVNSQPGKGASFSFSIWFEKVYKNKTSPTMLTNQKIAGKVLLVDDNNVNLIVTKTLLETKQYYCETAENGFEAIEKVKEKTYDLILMDIMMPGINGFETTQKIKEANIQTPVVALTAVDVNQNQEDFDRVNFAAVITKPFIPDEFFDIVKNAIGRS
ncbi:response regulator [Niabella ginsengisoli]|uniref:histidine kinase n=1 Tax=Niabella ginsengisoli TaxID=522298 RepID=A0ABS9SR03_9BACT|nr:response regulator [Niabella ginsengisoli]